jgi:hypothetical protein
MGKLGRRYWFLIPTITQFLGANYVESRGAAGRLSRLLVVALVPATALGHLANAHFCWGTSASSRALVALTWAHPC